jgi:glutamine amidotransferase PdxT
MCELQQQIQPHVQAVQSVQQSVPHVRIRQAIQQVTSAVIQGGVNGVQLICKFEGFSMILLKL